MAEEKAWLPACSGLAKTEIRRSPSSPDFSKSSARPLASFIAILGHASVLSIGQIFMMTAVACSCGSIATVIFGQSYERVMFHCGPQDTIVGVFSVLAMPLFWAGWFLHKKKILKVLLLPLCACAAFFLGATVAGIPAILISLVLFACLAAILYFGSFFASWKSAWPRRFKPTLFLSISYILAVVLLAIEFIELNLIGEKAEVTAESLVTTCAIVCLFVITPAFITVFTAGTKRFGTAIGLAAIAQMPLLATVTIYMLSNLVMLACFYIFGQSALAQFFADLAARNGLTPDFDPSSTNQAELLAKFFSSLIIWLTLQLSLLFGANQALLCNRRGINNKWITTTRARAPANIEVQ